MEKDTKTESEQDLLYAEAFAKYEIKAVKQGLDCIKEGEFRDGKTVMEEIKEKYYL